MNIIYTIKTMTKSRLILFIFSLCVFALSGFSQPILVFNENFETGGGTFTLNGTNQNMNNSFGSNKWIVNNIYFPSNLSLPMTPVEDSTCGSGNITLGPFGHYLHI